MIAKYNHLLQTRPIVTKMITSGTIGALGDALCQIMENCKPLKVIILNRIREGKEGLQRLENEDILPHWDFLYCTHSSRQLLEGAALARS